MTSSCPICCEEYTKQLRSKIVCINTNCASEACISCIKQYLLSTTNDAHCMSCKMPYEYKYLVEIVSNNWLTKDYQKHRKKLLLDRELSQIPATKCSSATSSYQIPICHQPPLTNPSHYL